MILKSHFLLGIKMLILEKYVTSLIGKFDLKILATEWGNMYVNEFVPCLVNTLFISEFKHFIQKIL